MTSATVTSSLPLAANSGQCWHTLSSYEIRPSFTNLAMQIAVTLLPALKMVCNESVPYGLTRIR